MELQILDLRHFTCGNPSQRTEFGKLLVDGFMKHGFVKLTNHGFTDDLIQELFEKSKQFFDSGAEIKLQVANPPGPNPQRGWTDVGMESTAKLVDDPKDRSFSDAKEHFDQGPTDDLEFPNRWPELPGFRPFMEFCYKVCDNICMEVMRALEVGLQLPVDSLAKLCVPNASDLRLNHYPTSTVKLLKHGNTNRISPHTDFGIISLLLQDGVGGLEIENRERLDSFIPVPPQSSEMIVNVSDTLQRWTNDVLKAGIHQVTVPCTMVDEEAMIQERFSMAYFFKAGRHVSVGPLDTFISLERPPIYQEITALQFQKWRNYKMYA